MEWYGRNMSRALEGSQRGEQRDHEAKKVNAASAHKITASMVAGGAVTKVGDGLGWTVHHLPHPAHPRYAPAQGQQQQEKGKPVFPRYSQSRWTRNLLGWPAVLAGMRSWILLQAQFIPVSLKAVRPAAPAHKAPSSARWR